MISDEEAAWLLFGMSRSLPPSMKQSVVEAIEREERVFVRVPRQKRRSVRIPRTSFSTAVVEYVSKENPNAHIHDSSLMESPTNPTRNCNKGRLLFPPMEKQPNKKERSNNRRLPVGASSSGTRELRPEWLSRLMTSKNGTNLKKIIDKVLTATDVSSGHGRLSMPFNNIIDLDFLNPMEERIIQEHVTKHRSTGVEAKLILSSDLKEYDLNLRRWNMKKKKKGSMTSVYNLVTGWNQVVEDCGLKVDDEIRLWSFHSDCQLYFVLLPPPPSDSGESNSG